MDIEIQTSQSYHRIATQHSQPSSSPNSDSEASVTSSVFSVDATSQTSEGTCASSDDATPHCWRRPGEEAIESSQHTLRTFGGVARQRIAPLRINTQDAVPVELRQNPRRCMITANQRPPPALVRQSERKGQFVDSLVDSATVMVEVIWPLSVPHCRSDGQDSQGVLPLRFFIQETLRRSKTSFSTLQVALYYLILIKAYLPRCDFTMEQSVDSRSFRALQCGRRMFLAALILASKYLQDRNYSAKAWSKISGLKVCEINANEMAFLKTVNWKLHVPESLFDRWQEILLRYTVPQSPTSWSPSMPRGARDWRTAIALLNPELDNLEVPTREPLTPIRPVLERANSLRISTSPAGVYHPAQSPIATMPPHVLEPTPHMPPPTPGLVRMGPLPTPALTPQSAISNTPAASFAGYESRRPSLGSAMAQAQSQIQAQSYNNTCVDFWSNPAFTARRPSVISAPSLSSSPESMISDNSRFSRSSSISSAYSIASSNACAPVSAQLARMATLRNAGLTCNVPSWTAPQQQQQQCLRNKESQIIGSISMEPITLEPESSPDLAGFSITDASGTTLRSSRRTKQGSEGAPKRKRGRSSIDETLQKNVRSLLAAGDVLEHQHQQAPYVDLTTSPKVEIISEPYEAVSHLALNSRVQENLGFGHSNGVNISLSTSSRTTATVVKALQSPARSVPDRRLPVTRDLGRKRTCYASSAEQAFAMRRDSPIDLTRDD